MIDDSAKQTFQTEVWDYYHAHGRHDLPWRLPNADGSFDPYHVLVSELMLQQTQVSRVTPKYLQFLENFATISQLSTAPLGEVLRIWSGLGYNRRAKFLHQAAQQIRQSYGGQFPQQPSELVKLAGVGPNTAGAIAAYAFNQPVTFIETNIRTVFIHHFYHDQMDVADKQILELVGQSLDSEHPREWYWALMDYGAHLKQTIGNPNHRSKSYAKQSAFHGSRRQLRGQLIRLLGGKEYSLSELHKEIDDQRLADVINDLLVEGLITQRGQRYRL